MINVKIRILRGLLEEAINNIDAGNSNHTEEELSEIIDDLTKLNRGIKRISKTYACEKILHCSPSTFDTYVKLGIIPPGHKELSWSEKDFDEATLNKDIVTVNSVIVSFLFVRFRTSCRSRLQITDLLTNLKLNDYEIRRRNGRKELRTGERWE